MSRYEIRPETRYQYLEEIPKRSYRLEEPVAHTQVIEQGAVNHYAKEITSYARSHATPEAEKLRTGSS
jgi:hypothetical protein